MAVSIHGAAQNTTGKIDYYVIRDGFSNIYF